MRLGKNRGEGIENGRVECEGMWIGNSAPFPSFLPVCSPTTLLIDFPSPVLSAFPYTHTQAAEAAAACCPLKKYLLQFDLNSRKSKSKCKLGNRLGSLSFSQKRGEICNLISEFQLEPFFLPKN